MGLGQGAGLGQSDPCPRNEYVTKLMGRDTSRPLNMI